MKTNNPDPATTETLAEVAEAKAARENEVAGGQDPAPAGGEPAPWRKNGATGLQAFASVFVVVAIVLFIAALGTFASGCAKDADGTGVLMGLLLAAGGVGCLFLRLACLALAAMADAASRYLDRESPAEP